MSKNGSKARKPSAPPKPKKCVVLFGLDENGKPRAAKFENEDEAVLSRLAQARGLRVGVVQGKHPSVIAKLPLGRVFATGNGSVGLVSKAVYDELNQAAGGEHEQISCSLPGSRDEIRAGHLVIAQTSLADGWWEFIVVSREDGTLRLRYRDFPGEPELLRDVSAVALLDSQSRTTAAPSTSEQENGHDA